MDTITLEQLTKAELIERIETYWRYAVDGKPQNEAGYLREAMESVLELLPRLGVTLDDTSEALGDDLKPGQISVEQYEWFTGDED